MGKTLLFALGHYGEEKDFFTKINIERFEKLKELCGVYKEADIITSGYGVGEEYSRGYSWQKEKEYLMKKIGIDEEKIIGGMVIYNTVDQVFLVQKAAIMLGYDSVILISSDYHRDRILEIIKNVWDSTISITLECSVTHFENPTLEFDSKEHERKALEHMRQGNFYLNEYLQNIENVPIEEVIVLD